MNAAYRETVRLLLTTIPTVFRTSGFAMKGGTAINLFVRDMPRLSVDIDVAFTRLDLSRAEALQTISSTLGEIARNLQRQGIRARVAGPTSSPESKLFASVEGGTSVTIEVNPVIRGTVLPVETHELSPAAQTLFAMSASAPILAPAELYGGKLVAMLDRQHPRDLFDVLLLLENEGLTDEVVQCFVIYLASASRPAHELLKPNLKDIKHVYENEFVGMTERQASLDELLSARERVPPELLARMTDAQRTFLLSLTRGQVDWHASGIAHAEQLPALQWKLGNILKLATGNTRKHTELVRALERTLG